MPESQFGPAPDSLVATLDELVALARHLKTTPASVPGRLSRLEGLSQMLRYFSSPPMMQRDDSQPPVAVTTHCSFHNCSRTWRDADACLLNFARRGEPPIWLCRDHHPPLDKGTIRPPGWQPDTGTRDALEDARHEALSRLSRDDLKLVNPRAGG